MPAPWRRSHLMPGCERESMCQGRRQLGTGDGRKRVGARQLPIPAGPSRKGSRPETSCEPFSRRHGWKKKGGRKRLSPGTRKPSSMLVPHLLCRPNKKKGKNAAPSTGPREKRGKRTCCSRHKEREVPHISCGPTGPSGGRKRHIEQAAADGRRKKVKTLLPRRARGVKKHRAWRRGRAELSCPKRGEK